MFVKIRNSRIRKQSQNLCDITQRMALKISLYLLSQMTRVLLGALLFCLEMYYLYIVLIHIFFSGLLLFKTCSLKAIFQILLETLGGGSVHFKGEKQRAIKSRLLKTVSFRNPDLRPCSHSSAGITSFMILPSVFSIEKV